MIIRPKLDQPAVIELLTRLATSNPETTGLVSVIYKFVEHANANFIANCVKIWNSNADFRRFICSFHNKCSTETKDLHFNAAVELGVFLLKLTTRKDRLNEMSSLYLNRMQDIQVLEGINSILADWNSVRRPILMQAVTTRLDRLRPKLPVVIKSKNPEHLQPDDLQEQSGQKRFRLSAVASSSSLEPSSIEGTQSSASVISAGGSSVSLSSPAVIYVPSPDTDAIIEPGLSITQGFFAQPQQPPAELTPDDLAFFAMPPIHGRNKC